MLKVDEKLRQIRYEIPLTTPTGKVRIKRRTHDFEYGLPFATKTIPFDKHSYVEWQIGYDLAEKYDISCLSAMRFIGANEKCKCPYELSEIIYWFIKWGVIDKKDVRHLIDRISNVPNENLLDVNPNLSVKRAQPAPAVFSNIQFEKSHVAYPLLIHKLDKEGTIAEIIIREKQRAVGTQPMLYFCFPVAHLDKNLIGRTAKTKETAQIVINSKNAGVYAKIFEIFGLLSRSHKHDVLEILKLFC